MHPYTSPAEVRAWYDERLAAAAHTRRTAARAQGAPHARGWRKLVTWFTARRPMGALRQLETGPKS